MRKKRGFTLIELLICFTIIGVLSGGLLVASSRAPGRAEAARIAGDLRTLGMAARVWYTENRDSMALSEMERIVSEQGILLLEPYVDGVENRTPSGGRYEFRVEDGWWIVACYLPGADDFGPVEWLRKETETSGLREGKGASFHVRVLKSVAAPISD